MLCICAGSIAIVADADNINNGIIGNARRSTAALGKQFIDLKVDDGVIQIK
jgi:hypothetical protein